MSALVYQTSDEGFRFNLQGRAVTKDVELHLSQTPTPAHLLPWPFEDKSVTLAINIGLNYCPFCGTKLATLVTSSTKKSFEALAEEHKKFGEPLW